jgi:hypothetical protein
MVLPEIQRLPYMADSKKKAQETLDSRDITQTVTTTRERIFYAMYFLS